MIEETMNTNFEYKTVFILFFFFTCKCWYVLIVTQDLHHMAKPTIYEPYDENKCFLHIHVCENKNRSAVQ